MTPYLYAPESAVDAFLRSIFDLSSRNNALFEVEPDRFVSREHLCALLARAQNPVPDCMCDALTIPRGSTLGDAARHQQRRSIIRELLEV